MNVPVADADDGAVLDVLVVPRSSHDRVVGIHGDRVRIQLTAPPVEGAANAALVELLAEQLARPRDAIAIVAGSSSRRKRVRVRGLDAAQVRARLGLLALALATAASGSACAPFRTEIELDVIVPEDADDLDVANNASLVLDPGGQTHTLSADGLDFQLSLELDPDAVLHTVSLYLAQDETLLAWGRTPSFSWGAAERGLGLFLGRPAAASTFPLALDLPDDQLLAAHAFGRGVVMLSSDGATSFLDDFTLQTAEAAALSHPPATDDGALVGDALGGVMRVTWRERIAAHRFDPGDDAWVEVAFEGADALGGRDGAVWTTDGAGTVLTLIGGPEGTAAQTAVVAIDLAPRDDGGLFAVQLDDVALDVPRPGAAATWIVRQDGDDDDDILLFGHGEAAPGEGIALARWLRAGVDVGPPERASWQQARCVQLDRGRDGEIVRVLCGGGIRDGSPTGDVEQFDRGPDGDTTWTHHAALLDPPLPDPRWWRDDVAVYAQGEGVLQRFDRTTLAGWPASDPSPVPALRGHGGTQLTTDTGAVVLAGGVDATGAPATRLQVFVPAVPSD